MAYYEHETENEAEPALTRSQRTLFDGLLQRSMEIESLDDPEAERTVRWEIRTGLRRLLEQNPAGLNTAVNQNNVTLEIELARNFVQDEILTPDQQERFDVIVDTCRSLARQKKLHKTQNEQTYQVEEDFNTLFEENASGLELAVRSLRQGQVRTLLLRLINELRHGASL